MKIRDLQREIGEWHVQAFGETNDRAKANAQEKLEEEMQELQAAMLDANAGLESDIESELADTLIAILGFAFRLGIDLESKTINKFDIVRNRNQRARDAERGIEWGAK